MSTKQAQTLMQTESITELAGELFDGGLSCTRAVFQAVTGSNNRELLAMTTGFSCGLGKSGCLCGAVSGGVMALGLRGRGNQSGQLVAAFKAVFQTTCCRGLSKGYHWMSLEHQANCREITVRTTVLVEKILQN